MMRWWLDRGHRRVPDGRHQHDLQGDLAARRCADPGPPHLGDGTPHFLNGPRIHEFLQEMHAAVFEGRAEKLLTVGEMPGVTVEDAILYTDPDAPRGRHGLPVRARRSRPRRAQVGPQPARPARPQGLARSLAGRARRGRLELALLEQPRPAARGVAVRLRRLRSTGSRRPSCSATVLHLHRGTPYVYQGEELGMTNVPFATRRRLPRHRVGQLLPPGRRGGWRRRGDPAPTCGSAAATTPAPRCSGTTPRNAGFTTGKPWSATNPNYTEINAAAAVADDDSVFHHYRRVIELRHTEPAVAHGDFTMLAPDHPTLYAFTRSHEGTELLVLANFSGDDLDLDDAVDDLDGLGRTRRCCSATSAPPRRPPRRCAPGRPASSSAEPVCRVAASWRRADADLGEPPARFWAFPAGRVCHASPA